MVTSFDLILSKYALYVAEEAINLKAALQQSTGVWQKSSGEDGQRLPHDVATWFKIFVVTIFDDCTPRCLRKTDWTTKPNTRLIFRGSHELRFCVNHNFADQL